MTVFGVGLSSRIQDIASSLYCETIGLISAHKYQRNLCKLFHKMIFFLYVTVDSGPFYEAVPLV